MAIGSVGVSSTCALTGKKLGNFIDPGFQTGVAMAGEKAGSADVKAIGNKYPHLLSPLRIRNKSGLTRLKGKCPNNT